MSNQVLEFNNVRLRSSRGADPVRINVRVHVDDVETAVRMGAKLALIRYQDECRRTGTIPENGATVDVRLSNYAGERRSSDPLAKAKQQLAKLAPEEREKLLRELGLL